MGDFERYNLIISVIDECTSDSNIESGMVIRPDIPDGINKKNAAEGLVQLLSEIDLEKYFNKGVIQRQK